MRIFNQYVSLASFVALIDAFACSGVPSVTGNSGGSSSVSGGASSGGKSTSGGTSAGGNSGATGGSVVRQPTCPAPATHALTEGTVPAGYCAWRFAENLRSPRGITRDSQGQLLVVEASANCVTMLYDDNGDGYSAASERLTIAQASGINHGIAINGGYLYASSASTIYRWPYTGSRSALGTAQTVVTGIPTGGHSTRTLAFDPDGNLYVSIGSGSNLDTNFNRARVVRYPAATVAAANGTWTNFQAFADGTRNEVGLRFDSQNRLWGVENGSDDLSRTDLGGDIHQDNPAEELNLFAQAGFYGYPYCWSEGNLPSFGLGTGTQWAYPSVMNDGTHTDAWCRNTANVKVPLLSMQAHSAPLDLLFYTGGSFPSSVVGGLFVTFHGSWDRTAATGYKVVRIPFSAGVPSGSPQDFLTASNPAQPDSWGHRPVGLVQGVKGELYVTSDASGIVIAVGHDGT